MKTLHLLRHAKSSWRDTTLDDHDRPLAKRGLRAATLLAEHLVRSKIVPDLVLCSTALRARQTLDAIAGAITPARVVFGRELYEAGPRRLMSELHKVPDAAECVLLIGHNPGLHDFALTLIGREADGAAASLRTKFPTASLASFAIEDSWRDLRPHGAALLAFITPKHLAATD